MDGSLNDGVADNLPLLDDVLALQFSRRGGATTGQVAGDSCHDLMYSKRVPKYDSIASTIPLFGCHDLDVLKCMRGLLLQIGFLSLHPAKFVLIPSYLSIQCFVRTNPFLHLGGSHCVFYIGWAALHSLHNSLLSAAE
eukprot:scaffold1811_cov137-Skeletonema_marinoi.AAC.19